MMKQLRTLVLKCCVASALTLQLAVPAFSQTAIPRQMSYQGVLREGDKVANDGMYAVKFSMYSRSEGGVALWSEVQTVELRGGLFNVILGQFMELPSQLPAEVWLGMSINSSPEMPRTKLTSVPFALMAGSAQALSGDATGAVLSLNGQQGTIELRATDGFEVRADKGVLTIGKTSSAKEEEVLNQGTEWLLAGNTNATTSHWLGTSNDIPLIVKTNNTERLRVQSTGNGNVGIGETNPGSRLTVARTFHLTNAGGAPELKLSAASGSASTTFKTGTQLTSVTYTLPNSAPSSNGQVLTSTTTGLMTWSSPVANLAHFTEGFHNAAPNAAITVASFTPKLAVPNMDVAIVPKGTGALLADIPDGTALGGNKRGQNAVDLQTLRDLASHVASGNYSTVSGGAYNTASGNYSTVSGGFHNTASTPSSTVSGGDNNTASVGVSTVSGGSGNTASGYSSTVSGGVANTANGYSSTVSGGVANTASGSRSTISGGESNTAGGDFSSIFGGRGLTLSGNGSVGYLGNNIDGSRDMTISADNTAVFGNVDLWLVNNDNTAHELRMYEASGSGSNYTAFKAGTQGADIVYTLPTSAGSNGQVLTTNGSGVLSWTTASGGGLQYFTENRNTTAPNATIPVHQIAATGTEASIDLALSPKGDGALVTDIPDGTATGGNKRGQNAVDLQTSRTLASHVASGNYSTVSGGAYNTASGNYSTVSGGFHNTASTPSSTVSGGDNNTASVGVSTVSGGSGNTASGYSSTVSGGVANTANGYSSTVSGGVANTASGSRSTISGGESNTAGGDFSSIFGGRGLTLSGNGSVGYLGNNIDGSRDMTISADNTAVFGNVDMWLVNNDSTAHELRMYEASGSGSNYTAFKAGAQNADIVYTLPTSAGSNGQVLTTNGSGVLSWTTASGGGGLTYFTESRTTSSPNATIPVHQLAATGTEADIDLAITPKGEGALVTDIPDGTATGGNKRGQNAVDLQTSRTLASQVASGSFSTVSGGFNNKASGNSSTISGGQNNTASGNYSIVLGGSENIANVDYSVVGGGFRNDIVEGSYGFVGGGADNTLWGPYSVIVGGEFNTTSFRL
jgi:hypothetical protein